MAKTRVTLRVKPASKKMTITNDETPATPVSTVSIPEVETPASSIYARLQDDLVDSDTSVSNYKKIGKKHPNLYAKDPMEIDKKPKTKKMKPTSDDDDDDDDIPVGNDYVKTEPNDTEESDDEEVYVLGNIKVPEKPVVPLGNGRSGIPIAFIVPNTRLSDNVYAHLAVLCYGFSHNGDPKPGFHNHVLALTVKNGDLPFFTTRNVGEGALVDLVDVNGDVIKQVLENNSNKDKKATAVWIVTKRTQDTVKLDALFKGFLAAVNQLMWNGTLLTKPVVALTPHHIVEPLHGIGKYVGQTGCENLIMRFFNDFKSRNKWGKDHKQLLLQLWNPGNWTLDNATFFGAPGSFMMESEKAKYKEQIENRKKNNN
jgi:hypothetical protein